MKTLIIGQGLAGTTLAHRLLERDETVYLIDNKHKHASSLVAAGLWNPIVFKRMNKSWMADTFLDEMNLFYPRIEKVIRHSFFQPKSIYRMHGSKEESDLWVEKKSLPGYQPYLLRSQTPDVTGFSTSEFGSGEVVGAGYVQMQSYLEDSAAYFANLKIFKSSNLEWPSENEDFEKVTFGKLEVDRIVDCRGVPSAQSKCWNFLPFNPTKGEVLTIHAPLFKLEAIFNAGFFILPLGDDQYRVGATFDWKNLDYTPSSKGKETLVSKLKKWTQLPFEIIDHKAGIRPTVKDRRPLIGSHPEIDKLFIFNGLGAKGVMMAPYLSAVFADFLCEGKPLPREVDIARFY